MFLFFETNDNVTRLETWLLIAFTTEQNPLSIDHALVNVNLKNLPVSYGFFAVAMFATIASRHLFTLTSTVIALALHVLNHRRSQLLDNHVNTVALARGTPFHRTFLTTDTCNFNGFYHTALRCCQLTLKSTWNTFSGRLSRSAESATKVISLALHSHMLSKACGDFSTL